MANKYTIYKSSTAGELGEVLSEVILSAGETFPVNIPVTTHGKHYFRITETNEHGESEPSFIIEGVSVAPATTLNIQNGIGRVTINGVMPTGANTCVIEADIGIDNWETQYNGAVTSYVITETNKLFTRWRYKGAFGTRAAGDLSAIFEYVNPMVIAPVLALTDNQNGTLTFTYTGDDNALEVNLMRQSIGKVETFNLDTKTITINALEVDATYYAEAICGLKILQSNTIPVNSKLPVRSLSAQLHPVTQSSIAVSWTAPLNSTYTGTRVSWISPSGVEGSYDTSKAAQEYSIPIDEAGVWQITARAIYAGGLSSPASVEFIATLPAITNLVVTSPLDGEIFVSWTPPVNTNHTDFYVRYKLDESSNWYYKQVAKLDNQTSITVYEEGVYTVNVAARYGSALTPVWYTSNQNVSVTVSFNVFGTSVIAPTTIGNALAIVKLNDGTYLTIHTQKNTASTSYPVCVYNPTANTWVYRHNLTFEVPSQSATPLRMTASLCNDDKILITLVGVDSILYSYLYYVTTYNLLYLPDITSQSGRGNFGGISTISLNNRGYALTSYQHDMGMFFLAVENFDGSYFVEQFLTDFYSVNTFLLGGNQFENSLLFGVQDAPDRIYVCKFNSNSISEFNIPSSVGAIPLAFSNAIVSYIPSTDTIDYYIPLLTYTGKVIIGRVDYNSATIVPAFTSSTDAVYPEITFSQEQPITMFGNNSNTFYLLHAGYLVEFIDGVCIKVMNTPALTALQSGVMATDALTYLCGKIQGSGDANRGVLVPYTDYVEVGDFTLTVTKNEGIAQASWTPATNAQTYEVYIDGRLVGSTTNTYWNVPLIGDASFYVKAVSSTGTFKLSNSVDYKYYYIYSHSSYDEIVLSVETPAGYTYLKCSLEISGGYSEGELRLVCNGVQRMGLTVHEGDSSSISDSITFGIPENSRIYIEGFSYNSDRLLSFELIIG